jgi:hypothetical protein
MCITTRRIRRAATALLVVATLTLPATGCAVLARVLTTAEAISAVHDLASAPPVARTVTGGAGISGIVTGTRGTGLRLKDHPGGHRIAAFPDGTRVTIGCHSSGPRITGPAGATSMWSRVLTPDGRRGYMSEAYLRIDHASSDVPTC